MLRATAPGRTRNERQRGGARRPATGQTVRRRSGSGAGSVRALARRRRRAIDRLGPDVPTLRGLALGGLAFVWFTLGVLGCQSPALVRTARTLPEGGSDLSFSLNLTRVSLREDVIDGPAIPLQDFNLPNPIPDVLYDYGVTDDLELGARLSLGSGLIEAHSKLRFIEAADSTLHLALAPALGYRVLALVNGPVLTLPLIITYDLSPGMSLSGGPLVSYAAYSVPSRLDLGDLDLSGDTLYAGGGFGLEFRTAFGIHVMPALELQRSLSRRGDIDDLPVIDLLFLGVTFGWGSPRTRSREPTDNELDERPRALGVPRRE
jgi:hypothetical protein